MTTRVVCFLLREQMLPLLESLHYTVLTDAAVREDEEQKPIARFSELLRESVHWQRHSRDWYLHGTARGSDVPKVLKTAVEDVQYLDLLAYVERLAKAYPWSLVPWGVDYTGEMLAFVSSDDSHLEKVMNWLQATQANADLVVSGYTAEELSEKRFRGAIFHRSAELRGQGLWAFGRGMCESALVLRYSSESRASSLPPGAEIVSEVRGHERGHLRSWIRVHDEAALLQYVGSPFTVMVTGSDLDERLRWFALQEFAQVAEYVSRDPLRFGLQVLHSASWIYVPATDGDRWEIYMANDPTLTSSLLQSGELLKAPYFAHKYFC